nr:sodium-dependent bicarbonate transport family permease [Tardiphaga sp.]
MTLAASASYIAVPAAMRLALPAANPAIRQVQPNPRCRRLTHGAIRLPTPARRVAWLAAAGRSCG